MNGGSSSDCLSAVSVGSTPIMLSDFGVTVLAEDKKDTTPLFVDTQDTLHALGLPVYSYQQMIDGIQEEISNFLR